MTKKAKDAEKYSREQIWEKIRAIRHNHNNPSKLKSLLDEWDKAYGTQCNDLAKEILAEQTCKAWAAVAKRNQTKTIDDLMKMLWENWDEGEFTISKKDNEVQIYCTKCPIADTYRLIGEHEYGLIFQCSEDPHIVAGFNPEIKFRRTKTLMNGDDCCDHHYSMM